MKLLLLGGTNFLGPRLVEAALEQGHEVTLFNRGKRKAEVPVQVEQLRGDRDGELGVLAGREWDAVIDTSGYVPRLVQAAAQALSEAVERYIFISSISVYADFSKPGIDESFAVATLEDESVEEITEETYGALKALCEQAAEQVMPGRVLVVRPGLIVGPGDPTDRFTYWPYRVAQGGEMLAPGSPDERVQVVDVRDLARWIIHMAEEGKTGVYNTTGPEHPLTMGELLNECKAVTGSDAQFVWVSNAFMMEREVDVPLWVPDGYEGFGSVNCDKAISEGLRFRPLEETIRDTLAWRGQNVELRTGLKREQEQQLLGEWRAERG